MSDSIYGSFTKEEYELLAAALEKYLGNDAHKHLFLVQKLNFYAGKYPTQKKSGIANSMELIEPK